MLWQIRSFPKCDYHVFLSHSQEDRDPLVEPTRIKLAARNVVTWFDQQDYYYGRPSRAALRDGILKSRHTVHFITDAMLGSSRGWCVMELSLVELLQGNLQVRGGQLAHPMLPLFFVSQDDRRLARSVWQDLRDQGRFCPPNDLAFQIDWAENQIIEFLMREQRLANDMAIMMRRDAELKSELKKVQGLHDRITAFHPGELPVV